MKNSTYVGVNSRIFIMNMVSGNTAGMTNDDRMAFDIALKMARVKQAVKDKMDNVGAYVRDYRRSVAALVNGRSMARLTGRMAGHRIVRSILRRIRHLALCLMVMFAPHKGNTATVRVYA